MHNQANINFLIRHRDGMHMMSFHISNLDDFNQEASLEDFFLRFFAEEMAPIFITNLIDINHFSVECFELTGQQLKKLKKLIIMEISA